ncbi:hypothetical protein IWX49DRAFT_156369 [Phyllosticta citricarpa]|uniref:Uncharacterized protein n=1 Tax=Phyllosticta citricarpa TaxID=55181 RepID=A0ABR1MHQ0_9PEZI
MLLRFKLVQLLPVCPAHGFWGYGFWQLAVCPPFFALSGGQADQRSVAKPTANNRHSLGNSERDPSQSCAQPKLTREVAESLPTPPTLSLYSQSHQAPATKGGSKEATETSKAATRGGMNIKLEFVARERKRRDANEQALDFHH